MEPKVKISGHLAELLRRYPKRTDGIASYKAILEAAEMLFPGNKEDAITLAALTQKAGVAAQTVYIFFPDPIPDLVRVLRYFRWLRVKNAIRAAGNHAALQRSTTIDESKNASSLPLFYIAYIVLHAIFKTMREKPTLDHALATYCAIHEIPSDLDWDESLVDEVAATIQHLSSQKVDPNRIRLVAVSMIYGTRGIVEGWCAKTSEGLSLELEKTLIQMYSLLLAQQLGPDSCIECKQIRAFDFSRLFSSKHAHKKTEPVTSTVPWWQSTVDPKEARRLAKAFRPPRKSDQETE